MKKIIIAAALLCSTSVFAADLSIPKAPPAQFNLPPSWNGFWIGIRGGYGVNSTNAGTITDGVVSIDLGTAPKGVVGGLNAGLDYQISNLFVVGLYIEQDFADLRTSASMAGGISLANVTNYLGAAGGRFGFLVTPTTLAYVKGGFAWVGAHPDFAAVGTSKSITDTSTGYELGVGLEHQMTRNWSIKIEYDHTKVGDKTLDASGVFDAPPGTVTSIAHYTIDKGMLGVNYRF